MQDYTKGQIIDLLTKLRDSSMWMYEVGCVGITSPLIPSISAIEELQSTSLRSYYDFLNTIEEVDSIIRDIKTNTITSLDSDEFARLQQNF